MATLEFKEDWEEAQRHLDAWWQCALIDRACIQVYAPRRGALASIDEEPFPSPEWPLTAPPGVRLGVAPTPELWRQWTDVEFVIARAERSIRCTFYGAEAFPVFWGNLGPDAFSAFLGSRLTLAETTTWTDPLIDTWRAVDSLQLDRENFWFRLQLQYMRQSMMRGHGRWFTGFPDTHTGGDALASLRGREQLCLDLYDHPEEVLGAMQRLTAIGREVYDVYFDILQPLRYGSTSGWLPTWGPGRCNVLQCDLIALISPAAWERFFVEWFLEELSWFDRVIFHLDGPPSLPHLDYLLALDKLKAIQWVAGDGALPMSQWIPLLKRIQAAGKAIHVSVEPWEVETMLRELSSRGLLMQTRVDSEEEARDLVAKVAQWTHD